MQVFKKIQEIAGIPMLERLGLRDSSMKKKKKFTQMFGVFKLKIKFL